MSGRDPSARGTYQGAGGEVTRYRGAKPAPLSGTVAADRGRAEAHKLAAEVESDRLAEHVRRTVASAPQLTADQLARLSALFRGTGVST